MYPSTEFGEAEWVAALGERPDIIFTILGDIYNVVRDEQERDAGVHRMGRRPMRAASSMEDMYATVLPQQYSLESFPVAFKLLLAGRSQRQFAARVPCNQATISRLLSGETIPDLPMLEAIAVACKVPPHYFVEYRAQFMGDLIQRIFVDRPHLGVSAMKRYRSFVRTTRETS